MATPTERFDSRAGNGTAPSADQGAFVSRPTAKPLPAKKGGAGKAIAILGVMAVLFILAIGGAAVGYYIYSNRAATAVDEPTPTPAPTVAPTPTVEPTVETASESNTSGETNSNSATASNTSPDVTTAPTPATSVPSTQQNQPNGPTARSTPQVVTRTTPARPEKTPVVTKATPKPADDRTKILQ